MTRLTCTATEARLGGFIGGQHTEEPLTGTHPAECPHADVITAQSFPSLSRTLCATQSRVFLFSTLPFFIFPFLLKLRPGMAPHKIILVHEILLGILEHLSSSLSTTSGDTAEDRTTLLSAALTCKRFLDPALSVLWRSIDDFIPLLVLFSSFQAIPIKGVERRSSYSYHATSYVSRLLLMGRNYGAKLWHTRHVYSVGFRRFIYDPLALSVTFDF